MWSSSIDLKFWVDLEKISLMCLSKSQGFWSCWQHVLSQFVFKSQFETISRKWQDLSIYEVKWAESLRDCNKHSFSCLTKISDQCKVICERCNFAKLLWQKFTLKRHQNKFLKWSKYNLGELEGRSLKIGKRKYIIKTYIQKFGM